MANYRSGLASSVGFAIENGIGAYGAYVPSTVFTEFLSESIAVDPTWLKSTALKSGQGFVRASRANISRYSVKGDLTFEAPDKGISPLLAQMIGAQSTPVQLGSTAAWSSYYNASDQVQQSLSLQINRPRAQASGGTNYAYAGMKVPSWDFTCTDTTYANFKVVFDGARGGRNITQVPGYSAVSPTYFTGVTPYAFKDAVALRTDTSNGGGITATAGVLNLSNPDTLATIAKSVTIKVANPMAVDRYGLGNAGYKAAQLENHTPTCMIDFDAEHGYLATTDSSTFPHDLMLSAARFPLQLVFQHGDAGGGNPYTLQFTFPACKMVAAQPMVSGPDLVRTKWSIEAFDPEDGNPTYQVYVVSQKLGAIGGGFVY